MIPINDRKDPRAVSHFKVCNNTEDWKNDLFYINQFLDKGLVDVACVELDDDCEECNRLNFEHQTKMLSFIKAFGGMYEETAWGKSSMGAGFAVLKPGAGLRSSCYFFTRRCRVIIAEIAFLLWLRPGRTLCFGDILRGTFDVRCIFFVAIS